jgi:hypothetical protein
MTIAFLTINKKYAYDVIMMIIFPLWSAYILKKIRKSSFSGWAVFSGGVQILVLTLIECMLYMESSNIWRVELAFVNIITLILGYRIYIWDKVQKKGNAVVLLIGYGLFWGLLLSMFHYSGESAVEYMAGVLRWDFSSPDSYISNVKTLVENAAYIGQSNNLLMDSYILDFLYESPNPIMSALFHGGWIAAIAVIVLEIVFAAAAGVLVLRKGKKQRMFDIVLYIAWLSLAIRVVAGILYTFGVPIPILLPFTSTVGIRMDSMAMGILILGYLIETLQGFFNKVLDDMIEDIVEDVEEPDDIEEPEEAEKAEKTKDTEDTEEAEKAEKTKDTEDTEEPEDTKEAEEAEEPEDTKEAEEAADTADNSSDCEEDADGESKGEV